MKHPSNEKSMSLLTNSKKSFSDTKENQFCENIESSYVGITKLGTFKVLQHIFQPESDLSNCFIKLP